MARGARLPPSPDRPGTYRTEGSTTLTPRAGHRPSQSARAPNSLQLPCPKPGTGPRIRSRAGEASGRDRNPVRIGLETSRRIGSSVPTGTSTTRERSCTLVGVLRYHTLLKSVRGPTSSHNQPPPGPPLASPSAISSHSPRNNHRVSSLPSVLPLPCGSRAPHTAASRLAAHGCVVRS